MNEIRAPELLVERYNTYFLGLVRKINPSVPGTPCCYSNNLASHPAKDMRGALKVKLQNVLNQVILADAEDRGIFIGGRRRNRKKKRSRNGKEKRKNKKTEGKNSPVIIRNNDKENVQEVEDKKPLIEPDFFQSITSLNEELDEPLPPLIKCDISLGPVTESEDCLPQLIFSEDEENQDPTKMPFGPFKKKAKATEETNDVAVLNEINKEQSEQKLEEQTPVAQETEVEAAQVEQEIQQREEIQQEVQEIEQEEKEVDEAGEETTQQETEVTEKTEIDELEIPEENAVVTESPKPENVKATKESAPLITRDQQPGFLCCTIL